MAESIILLAIYLIMILVGLAAAAWVAASGSILSIDGMFFAAAAVTVAVVFVVAFAMSVRSGEFADVVNYIRGRKLKGKENEGSNSSGAAA